MGALSGMITFAKVLENKIIEERSKRDDSKRKWRIVLHEDGEGRKGSS